MQVSRITELPSSPASPRRLILLLALGLVLVAGAWALRGSRATRDYILRSKDLPELEAIVQANPSDSVAQYHLGKRYYTSHRFADARIAYEAALRNDPGWARAHLGLGLSLYEEGAAARAREELERALSLDPTLAWAEYMLGKIAWSAGSVDEALPHVRRATELDPRSAEAWYGLGVCYTQQRDYPRAIDALRKAVARQDGNARYHTALGELLVYRGQADQGVKEYERALQLDPQFGPVCALMGRYLLQNAPGNEALDRAQELLLRAAKRPTLRPAEVQFNLGQLYVRKGEYDKSLEALKASLALEPRDERTFYALANAYRRLGRAKEAGETEARFRQISALHVQQQGLEAQVRHNPDDPSLHLRLARLYRGLGLDDKAAEQYTACLQLKSSDPEAARELERMARAQAPPVPSDFDLNLPAHESFGDSSNGMEPAAPHVR